jgi:U3 small nucleolar RNA-associated protein 10
VYNTEDLLLSFLPYYSTPLFLTVLSVTSTSKVPPTLKFLQPYMRSVKNPPSHAVLYAAATNASFFSTFNQHMLRIARNKTHSPALMSFWSSIASQAVDSILVAAQSGIASVQSEKMEAALLQILPVVNDALAIKDVPELGTGGCMIITILAARGNLQETVTQTLMEAVAANWAASNADARIICLATLAQRGNIKKLPKPVTKKLLTLDDLVERLEVISGSYQIDKLLLALFNRSVDKYFKSNQEKDLTIIEQILKRELLSKKNLFAAIKKLLTETYAFLHATAEYSEEDRETKRQSLARVFTWISTSPLALALSEAAQKNNYNLSTLDAGLQIATSNAIDGEQSKSSDEENDISPDNTQDRFDLSTLKLPESVLTGPSPSFLQTAMSIAFAELSQVFVKVAASETDLNQFLDLSILRKKDLKNGDPTLVSFLLRIACSNFPPKIRRIAVDSLTESLQKSGRGVFDYHVITPYIIHLLQDPHGRIRQAGARCLVEINKTFESIESHKIWAGETFYSNVEKGSFVLNSTDARILLSSVLLPNLEECVLDKTNVSQVLFSTLTKSSSKRTSKLNPSRLELKPAAKESIIAFVATHSAATTLLPVRFSLMHILTKCGKSASSARLTVILPEIRRWSKLSLDEANTFCVNQGVLLDDANESYFNCITVREQDGIDFLGQIVDSQEYRFDVTLSAYQRLEKIWRDISQESRSKLVSQILTVALFSPSNISLAKYREQAITVLRSLPLQSGDLVRLMETLPSATSMPEGPPAKKRRTSKTEALKFELAPQDTMDILRQYTLVLEVIDTSNPADHPELLKSLFDALGELQNFALQTNSNLGYLKGLVINSLLQIVDKLKDNHNFKIDRSSIRTDLVVDTIRDTSNAQLQTSCLLLISCLAMWIPDAVLHSVMPIFTFMSSTILRQGDDYSARVIDQTVSRVVPPLVASLRKRSRDVVSGVTDLLLSFTAAFEHVPPNRRLELFEHVVNALGPEDCLFAIVILIIDRHPTDHTIGYFVAELMDLYSAKVCLKV